MQRNLDPLMQTHLVLPIPRRPTTLPPTPPISDESLNSNQDTTSKINSARPRTESAASTSTEAVFSCQKGSAVFELLTEGIPRNDIAIGYTIDGGRHRFPMIPATPYDYTTSYSGRFQELHPGHFENDEFRQHWDSKPIVLQSEDVHFSIERKMRGVRFYGTLTKGAIDQIVRRGTVFIIKESGNPNVKYLTTFRRDLNTKSSIIQLNAYTKTQDRIRADHLDWPTITLTIPNSLCDVPIPAQFAHFLKDRFRSEQADTRMSKLKMRFLRFWNGSLIIEPDTRPFVKVL
ncbi:hypothetical protein GALMADRAFT_213551 [Galerina marginata CBS 339.88]|uniref:Uncharacterized protein n=1 Tax=Galerina marginata (strain CBS 339.88) TaxID=685588 RepID=A0A067SWQ0_GALM3|nr:hypothetical protein GALMADRAFT_213551 [Galerina marginata CBS 339.88]